MIDSTDDNALWLTAGEGEEMEDGPCCPIRPPSPLSLSYY